jgi:hypothetical protein
LFSFNCENGKFSIHMKNISYNFHLCVWIEYKLYTKKLCFYVVIFKNDIFLFFDKHMNLSQPEPWDRNHGKGLQECRTRGKPGRHILYSRECRRVWENEPSHSQVSSHFGSWSPDELPNLQGVIAGIKTHWIEEFFISLKSYWNVNV